MGPQRLQHCPGQPASWVDGAPEHQPPYPHLRTHHHLTAHSLPPSLQYQNIAQATEDYTSKIKRSFIPCCPIVLSCGCIQLSEHVSTSSRTLSESRVAEKYKYLGCTVNEHLECTKMIEERAKAGARALSGWMRSCRAMAREV